MTLEQATHAVSIVVDGKEGPEYASALGPVFSPDSRSLAYWARNAGKAFAVRDGVPGQAYDNVERIVFSPDSRRTAYIIWQRGARRVVVDGRVGPEYTSVRELVFSPDSRRFILALQDGKLPVPEEHFDALVVAV